MLVWLTRKENKSVSDKQLQKQLRKDTEHYHNILKRVIALVKYLAIRGLAFRGTEEVFRSPHNVHHLVQLLVSSSNAREFDEQILEVKINPQEKNTVSDKSTNKDTVFKEKESENENEETKLIRNDFAHYVGTPIDADLREQILKLNPYQPEGNFQKDAKERSFSSFYYSFISKAGQKIERKRLCYSTRLHVAYCQEEAIGLAKKWDITPAFEKKRHRKVRQFFDDFNADEKLH
ncbi:DUF4371 domain-containing protein [Trichonephila clavipes]|nr:DUF4371 domain-containing protein [Trichonephila clavipes]